MNFLKIKIESKKKGFPFCLCFSKKKFNFNYFETINKMNQNLNSEENVIVKMPTLILRKNKLIQKETLLTKCFI